MLTELEFAGLFVSLSIAVAAAYCWWTARYRRQQRRERQKREPVTVTVSGRHNPALDVVSMDQAAADGLYAVGPMPSMIDVGAFAKMLGIPPMLAGPDPWHAQAGLIQMAEFEPNGELQLFPDERIMIPARHQLAALHAWNRFVIFQESDRDWVTFFGFAGRMATGCEDHIDDLQRSLTLRLARLSVQVDAVGRTFYA